MQDSNGLHHVVVVVERLAHAHQNDVEAIALLPRKIVPLCGDDLPNNPTFVAAVTEALTGLKAMGARDAIQSLTR